MPLPFTLEQFLGVFENYNLSVWPIQIFLILLALGAIIMAFARFKGANKLITFILAFLWLWIGLAYHILFFTEINKSAYIFGALFIIQGILFLITGLRDKLSFKPRFNLFGIIGGILIFYALVIYPLLNYMLGHWWPYNPSFGLPCPTTIFTFGLLIWTNRHVPKYILIIPLLWSLIGVSAAINLGIWEDTVLVISGILGVILIWIKDRKK